MPTLPEALDGLVGALRVQEYRLAVLVELLVHGEVQHLPAATDDLEAASARVRAAEQLVTERARVAARLLGVSPGVPLRILADASPGSQRAVLHRCRDDLREVRDRIVAAIDLAVELSHASSGALRVELERRATGHVDRQYGRDGGPAGGPAARPHVDRLV